MRAMDRRVLAGGLLGGIASACGMALTATSGWLIVRAAEAPIMLTLMAAIVAVRTFGIARPVFRYWERLVSHDAALRSLARSRAEVYRALIPLTPARLGHRRRSEVLTAVVEDLTEVVESSVRVTVPVMSAAVAALLAVTLTTWVTPAAGLVMAALFVIVGLVALLAHTLESRSQHGLLAAREQVTRAGELVTAQADQLRAIGGSARALAWLDQAQSTLAAAVRTQARGRSLAAGAFLLAVGAAVAAMAFVARDADVSLPVKALLVVTPVAAGEVITPLVDAVRASARARASEERLRKTLGRPPAVHDDPATILEPAPRVPHDPDLRVAEVSARWDEDRPANALGPLSLRVHPGERVAVTGPNGGGKSTLLAVLARHLDPAGGRYELGGIDVRTVPVAHVRERVAHVTDEPHLFATTLRHNLDLARPDAAEPDLRDALVRAGLGPFLDDLPDGLDTRLGVGGRGLSGGELARLEIARAVLSERPVLLLDEPVAHLDPPTAASVLADVAALGGTGARGDVTVIMVSHRPEGLDHFDRVVTVERAEPIGRTGG